MRRADARALIDPARPRPFVGTLWSGTRGFLRDGPRRRLPPVNRTIDRDARWQGTFAEIRGLEIKTGQRLALAPLEKGPSLMQFVTGSVIVMGAKSVLHVHSGACLIIRTGTRMKMDVGARVIVDAGAHVYIEHKADVRRAEEAGFAVAEGVHLGLPKALLGQVPELRVSQPLPVLRRR